MQILTYCSTTVQVILQFLIYYIICICKLEYNDNNECAACTSCRYYVPNNILLNYIIEY